MDNKGIFGDSFPIIWTWFISKVLLNGKWVVSSLSLSVRMAASGTGMYAIEICILDPMKERICCDLDSIKYKPPTQWKTSGEYIMNHETL